MCKACAEIKLKILCEMPMATIWENPDLEIWQKVCGHLNIFAKLLLQGWKNLID